MFPVKFRSKLLRSSASVKDYCYEAGVRFPEDANFDDIERFDPQLELSNQMTDCTQY